MLMTKRPNHVLHTAQHNNALHLEIRLGKNQWSSVTLQTLCVKAEVGKWSGPSAKKHLIVGFIGLQSL